MLPSLLSSARGRRIILFLPMPSTIAPFFLVIHSTLPLQTWGYRERYSLLHQNMYGDWWREKGVTKQRSKKKRRGKKIVKGEIELKENVSSLVSATPTCVEHSWLHNATVGWRGCHREGEKRRCICEHWCICSWRIAWVTIHLEWREKSGTQLNQCNNWSIQYTGGCIGPREWLREKQKYRQRKKKRDWEIERLMVDERYTHTHFSFSVFLSLHVTRVNYWVIEWPKK